MCKESAGLLTFSLQVGQTSPTSHVGLLEIRPGRELQGALQKKVPERHGRQLSRLCPKIGHS